MSDIWINGYVSVSTINSIWGCWTFCPDNTDRAMALRFARLFGINNACADVKRAMRDGIHKQVEKFNNEYNINSDAGDNLLITLSVFMNCFDADGYVSGVNGDKKLQLRIDEERNRLVLTLQLVGR